MIFFSRSNFILRAAVSWVFCSSLFTESATITHAFQTCSKLVKDVGTGREMVSSSSAFTMFRYSRKSWYEEKDPCPKMTALSPPYSIGRAKLMMFALHLKMSGFFVDSVFNARG